MTFADQCDRYIAKTLYGDDEKEETPQSSSVDEPKLLGVHPTSNEKVFLENLALLHQSTASINRCNWYALILFDVSFKLTRNVSPFILLQVLLKNGPYGYYVQLGEDRKDYAPKRSSVSHVCIDLLA